MRVRRISAALWLCDKDVWVRYNGKKCFGTEKGLCCMIELIYATKGSGKTKKLIDLANAELATTKGDIVFIDDDKRYMYDVKHQIRFVDVTDYGIDTCDGLYGLLCGMVAQNFDIEAVYIDAFLKIIGKTPEEIGEYLDRIEKLTEKNEFKVVLSVSADPAQAPDHLREYII